MSMKLAVMAIVIGGIGLTGCAPAGPSFATAETAQQCETRLKQSRGVTFSGGPNPGATLAGSLIGLVIVSAVVRSNFEECLDRVGASTGTPNPPQNTKEEVDALRRQNERPPAVVLKPCSGSSIFQGGNSYCGQ